MRILLAEDDERVAHFIRKGLEEEQYRVHVADDGETALAAALSEEQELIILDLLLPRRDGMSVLTELRRRRIETPELILTARDAVEARVAALNAGGDDFLPKPFAFTELLARVRALLRRRGRETSTVLKVADLVMDPVMHRVTRADRLIDLTSREYALLRLFLQHPDQVLTRTVLAEQVWGCDFDSASNVVEVYVSYLRAKVDRGFHPKLIHTVRGAGYVLKATGQS
jgi:DNA-binding response OmpR family regulator